METRSTQQIVANADEEEEEEITSRLRSVMGQLKPRRTIPDDSVADMGDELPRPGSYYRRYRVVSELDETARLFYETVANCAGVTLLTLVRAVFQTEMKMGRLQEDSRRMEHHGGVADIDLSDADHLLAGSEDEWNGMEDESHAK